MRLSASAALFLITLGIGDFELRVIGSISEGFRL
jgi:hypothetical protein